MATTASRTRALAAIASTVAWTAVILQLVLSIRLSLANGRSIGWGIVVYLGYFTVLTNILVAFALSIPLLAPASTAGRFFRRPGPATAVAASILLVGVGYHVLLRTVWQPEGLHLVADVLLHYATPMLYLGYWLATIPKQDLAWSDILMWTLYPLSYFVYALIRGMVIGIYPYPFIDVGNLGYGRALMNALGILSGFFVIAGALVGTGSVIRTWRGTHRA